MRKWIGLDRGDCARQRPDSASRGLPLAPAWRQKRSCRATAARLSGIRIIDVWAHAVLAPL
jgi:hypothetical protein